MLVAGHPAQMRFVSSAAQNNGSLHLGDAPGSEKAHASPGWVRGLPPAPILVKPGDIIPVQSTGKYIMLFWGGGCWIQGEGVGGEEIFPAQTQRSFSFLPPSHLQIRRMGCQPLEVQQATALARTDRYFRSCWNVFSQHSFCLA